MVFLFVKGLSDSVSSFVVAEGGDMPTFDRFVIQGSPFVRLAGLSGAAAVALGAYGAHSKYSAIPNNRVFTIISFAKKDCPACSYYLGSYTINILALS